MSYNDALRECKVGTYQIESASTAISAFFKYPANNTNAIKYQVSKLHRCTSRFESFDEPRLIVNTLMSSIRMTN